MISKPIYPIDTLTVSMTLTKREMLREIQNTIINSGWVIIETNYPNHPTSIKIVKDDEEKILLIYVWNITHGGRTRSADEYRIQITGTDHLDIRTDKHTLLLGIYSEDEHIIFVSFDPQKHQRFGASPSIQVKKHIIDLAIQNGIAIQEKQLREGSGDVEIVIAFKQSLFMDTVNKIMKQYHNQTISQREIEILNLAQPLSDEEINLQLIPDERKEAIRKVKSLVRKSSFRDNVMAAYNSKCVICKTQLDLPEACHIWPVAGGGPDTVDNGIPLCPNHHKAYDKGIIDIDDSYNVTLVQHRIDKLAEKGLIEGLDNFIINSKIGEQIELPTDIRFNPNLDYLRRSRIQRGVI